MNPGRFPEARIFFFPRVAMVVQVDAAGPVRRHPEARLIRDSRLLKKVVSDTIISRETNRILVKMMRYSFALDPGLLEQIDRFAREHAFDRNEAILELIEAGLACQKDGRTSPLRQRRSFEDLDHLQRELEGVKEILTELRNEVHLVHHTIETDWIKEAKGVPFQTKRPWEFWRR